MLEAYYPLPPCSTPEGEAAFWSEAQALMLKAQQENLISVNTPNGKIIPYGLLLHQDGKIEILLKP